MRVCGYYVVTLRRDGRTCYHGPMASTPDSAQRDARRLFGGPLVWRLEIYPESKAPAWVKAGAKKQEKQ